MITKEKFRKKLEKMCGMYNHFFSKITIKDVIIFSFLSVLTYISIDNNIKIRKFIEPPALKEMEITEETTGKKGLIFLILKEEPKKYNLEELLGRYPRAKPYISVVEKAVEKSKDIWPNDPLLFLGLMRYESNFNKYAVSRVGAAGLAQFMPTTAQEIGRSRGWGVYLPDYYYKALHFNSKANKYENLAYSYLRKKQSKIALKYMSLSIDYRNKANFLFKEYKKEILKKVKGKSDEEIISIDWRFNDTLAIYEGVKHLSYLLKENEGYVYPSLSAYNAGSDAVRKAKGIPYIRETIYYINKIINFWKYWSKKLELPKP